MTTAERHLTSSLLLHPNPVVRVGFKGMLEDVLGHATAAECHEAADVTRAQSVLHGTRVDLVLIDPAALPTDDTAQLRACMLERVPQALLLGIALTPARLPPHSQRAANSPCGMRGPYGPYVDALIPIGESTDELIKSLADVLARHGIPGTSLSRREQEVSRLVGLGYTNRQIGRVLNISPHTVETYLQRLFDKLGVRSRAAIAARFVGPGPYELGYLRADLT